PYAVLDGNVFRVLARIFGIIKPVDIIEGKRFFSELATSLLNKKQPGLYNQAIMDFGAVICKPLAPLCQECPFKKTCTAFLTDTINKFPIKLKKKRVRNRWFYYMVMEYKNKIAIRQRTEKDIWQNLSEFLLIETEAEQKIKFILEKFKKETALNKNEYEVAFTSKVYSQQLTHQLISGQFIRIRLLKKPKSDAKWTWESREKIKSFAFPRFINYYLGQS
ncbi:MAG: NUDIX domain-containing protein, partial [Bacteroidota bacterium]|nr:NUDIX domain-containing protein [Bacteroidota bacterium]